MKISTLLLSVTGLMLLLSQPLQAQKDSIHTITLAKYKFDKLPAAVKSIQVVVSLWDTTGLGFVQYGMKNRKVKAQPATDYASWLQTYLDNQYGSVYNPSGASLLLVIKDLRINERTFSSRERAFVRLVGEAYTANENNQYQFAASVDTALDKGGLDVTKKHDKHIGEALHLLIEKGLKGKTGTEAFTIDDIRAKAASRFNIPILADTLYNKGVYLTFEEFKNDAPSITEFTMKTVKKKIKLYRIENGKEVEIEKFWGLSKDNELYKWHVSHLTAIEQIDHSFIISNYVEAANRKNKAKFNAGLMAGAGAAAGLVGALVATSVVNGTGEKAKDKHVCAVNAFPYLWLHPEASAVDMNLGELTF